MAQGGDEMRLPAPRSGSDTEAVTLPIPKDRPVPPGLQPELIEAMEGLAVATRKLAEAAAGGDGKPQDRAMLNVLRAIGRWRAKHGQAVEPNPPLVCGEPWYHRGVRTLVRSAMWGR